MPFLKGAKVSQLAAAMEIARRVSLPDGRKAIQIKGTKEAVEYLRNRLRGLAEEHFRVLYLNRRNRLLEDALRPFIILDVIVAPQKIFYPPFVI